MMAAPLSINKGPCKGGTDEEEEDPQETIERLQQELEMVQAQVKGPEAGWGPTPLT